MAKVLLNKTHCFTVYYQNKRPEIDKTIEREREREREREKSKGLPPTSYWPPTTIKTPKPLWVFFIFFLN